MESRLTFDTLIVGANEEAQHWVDLLGSRHVGFRPIGFISTSSVDDARRPRSLVGAIDRLRGLVYGTGAKCAFVAASAVTAADTKHVLKARRLDGIEIRVTANLPLTLATQVAIQSVGGLMSLTVGTVRLARTRAISKRPSTWSSRPSACCCWWPSSWPSPWLSSSPVPGGALPPATGRAETPAVRAAQVRTMVADRSRC
jgi:hypothetical protein